MKAIPGGPWRHAPASRSRRCGCTIRFSPPGALRVGQFIAHPPEPRPDLLAPAGDGYLEYRARLGDNYLHLAFVLEIDRDELRAENDLWHLQTLPAGQLLQLPLAWEGKHEAYTVQAGDDLKSVADKLDSTPWRIIRDNTLFWGKRPHPRCGLAGTA